MFIRHTFLKVSFYIFMILWYEHNYRNVLIREQLVNGFIFITLQHKSIICQIHTRHLDIKHNHRYIYIYYTSLYRNKWWWYKKYKNWFSNTAQRKFNIWTKAETILLFWENIIMRYFNHFPQYISAFSFARVLFYTQYQIYAHNFPFVFLFKYIP